MLRVSLLALMAAGPAAALTPDELIAMWEAQARAVAGQPLALPFERPGDGTAVLRGLGPDGQGAMTLRGLEDGTVAIEAALPETTRVPLGDGLGEVEWRQRGLAVIARDGATPGAVAYRMTADSWQVVTLPGADGEGAPFDAAVEMGDAAIEIEVPGVAGGGTLGVSVTAAGLAYVYSMGDPGIDITQDATARITDAAVSYAVTLPPGLTLATLAAMGKMPEDEVGRVVLQALRDGLAISVEASSGASSQTASVESPFVGYTYAITSAGSRGAFEASLAGISGSATSRGTTVSVSSPMMPMGAVGGSIGGLEFALDVPFADRPSPFTYRIALTDLAASEESWAAVDPGGHLSHDPGRLVMELGGSVALDAAAMIGAAMNGMPPPEPRLDSLELRELDLVAAGGRAMASGAVTFDALMRPTGGGTARIEGLDRILDALVAMGTVTPQDARDARLGIGVYFRAGDAPDTRETTFEMRPDGSATMNGVPLPM